MRKIVKWMAVVMVSGAGLILLSIFIIDHQFNHSSSAVLDSGCFKVWAHRGYFNGYTQNSIASFTKAFDLGAKGTELDIFYDLITDDYIVSHDYPYNLKNGRILRLEEVFRTVGERGYFWLDFKNLRFLSRDNTEKAVARLHRLLAQFRLNEKVIVESSDPGNLSIVSKSGLYTSYWITPKEKHPVAFWGQVYKYKIAYILGRFSAISMSYKLYGEKTGRVFSRVPVLLFTVNDKEILTALIKEENVRIVLTDKNHYLLESCVKDEN